MTEQVRVRDTSGHEVTVRADRALPDGVEVLDKPALGPDRMPAPPTYRLPLGKPRSGGKTARKRAAQKRAESTAPPPEPTEPVPAPDPEPEANGQQANTEKEKD